VRDGVEGFIVPSGDVDGIVQSLEKLVNDRNLLREMSKNARRRSTEFDFSVYRKNLLAAVLPDRHAPLPNTSLISTH